MSPPIISFLFLFTLFFWAGGSCHLTSITADPDVAFATCSCHGNAHIGCHGSTDLTFTSHPDRTAWGKVHSSCVSDAQRGAATRLRLPRLSHGRHSIKSTLCRSRFCWDTLDPDAPVDPLHTNQSPKNPADQPPHQPSWIPSVPLQKNKSCHTKKINGRETGSDTRQAGLCSKRSVLL